MYLIKVGCENNESIVINFDNVKYCINRKDENLTTCHFIDNTILTFENRFYDELNEMMKFERVSKL